MNESRVAKRYATALFNLALQQQAVEELDKELHDLAQVFRSRRLLMFLEQPQVSSAQKEAALMRAFGERSHPLVQNLLRLMLRKRGPKISVWVWDAQIMEYDDTQALDAGRIVLGTRDNGIMVPRVTIYGRRAD